jgi:transcription initiation factor TFIID subunit 2
MEHNAEDADLVKETMAEVDRYRSMDRLIPSYHNIVTIAALDVSRFPSFLSPF